MKKTDHIYKLELHESLMLDCGICVMRVPTGFIYDMWNTDTDQPKRGTFVPYEPPTITEQLLPYDKNSIAAGIDSLKQYAVVSPKTVMQKTTHHYQEEDGWIREMYKPDCEGLYICKLGEGHYEVLRWERSQWISPKKPIAWAPFNPTDIMAPF